MQAVEITQEVAPAAPRLRRHLFLLSMRVARLRDPAMRFKVGLIVNFRRYLGFG
jgi:hypothetical protein